MGISNNKPAKNLHLKEIRAPGYELSKFVVVIVLSACAAVVSGCAAFAVPEEPPRPTPEVPVWSVPEVDDHLEFLNDPSTGGRGTGTQGYARASAYVAARLHDFRLQPALDDFRVVYPTSINHPLSASMKMVGPIDSVVFLPGIDFLPDGRSDSGRVTVTRLVKPEDVPAATPPFAVVTSDAPTSSLQAWRNAGASLVVRVGDLVPQLEPAPVSGLLVVQLTHVAAAMLLPERRISVRVTTDFQLQAGALNILGYMAGKHPVESRKLVVVCADMDGPGNFAGVAVADFRNFGRSTAALLEVARSVSYVSHRWQLPSRSVMFAIWSGSRLGHQGLRHFLENPTWSLDSIASVIYIGLEDEQAVRDILSPYGISLHVIPPPDQPLFSQPFVLEPDPAIQRLARSTPAVPEPDESQIMRLAVEQSIALADSAYTLMMSLSNR